jgi:hypothetical protein
MKTFTRLFTLSFCLALARVFAADVQTVDGLAGQTIQLSAPNPNQFGLYQWKKNGLSLADGTDFAGTDTPILQILDSQVWDSGLYTVYYTGAGTTNVDPAASFQVGVYTAFVTNRVGNGVILGSGHGSVYTTWVKDGAVLQPGPQPSGAVVEINTAGQLIIYNLSPNEAGGYFVAYPLLEEGYKLTVLDCAGISGFQMYTKGTLVAFGVSSPGAAGYQWYWQGKPIPGATDAVLQYEDAYSQAPAGYYSVVVTNQCGELLYSPPPGLFFSKDLPTGSYQSIFYNTNAMAPYYGLTPPAITVDSSGMVQFTVSGKKRNFTGKMYYKNRSYRFSGKFGSDHSALVHLGSTADLNLQLKAIDDSAEVSGTCTMNGWSWPIKGYRTYFGGAKKYSAAGRYTLSMANTNLSRIWPDGAGIASVKISTNGVLTMSGRMGDGTPFSQGRTIAKAGEFPLYTPLYRGAGIALGWLQMTNADTGSISGEELYWLPATARYNSAIPSQMTAHGSTYTAPKPGENVLSFTDGVAVFHGGDLRIANADGTTTNGWHFSRVFYSVNTNSGLIHSASPYPIKPKAGWSFYSLDADRVSMKLNPGDGTLSGSFIDPVSGIKTPIKAIVLQQRSTATGYFLNANGSGRIELLPVQ